MPSYTFRNKETLEEWTEIMSISGRSEFLENNPHIIQLITTPPLIADPYNMGLLKPSNQMQEVFKRIHQNSGKGSTIRTGNLTEV